MRYLSSSVNDAAVPAYRLSVQASLSGANVSGLIVRSARSLSGQVSDLEPKQFVDGCLYRCLAVVDDVAQVAEAGDEGADVVLGELAGRFVVVPAGRAGEHGSALGLDLAGPLGDGFGVGSGVEGGAWPDRSAAT
jgi:hypothetical protein